MRPSKGITNLAYLRTMFGYLFEEIEFTANAKTSMQVSPCLTAMHKFHRVVSQCAPLPPPKGLVVVVVVVGVGG